MSEFEMLLIMKLNTIVGVGLIIGTISLITLLIFAGEYFVNDSSDFTVKSIIDDMDKKRACAKKMINRMLVLCCVSFSISIVVPTTKQAVILMVAPKIINSEFATKDLPKEAKELYGLAKQYLKDQVEEKK